MLSGRDELNQSILKLASPPDVKEFAVQSSMWLSPSELSCSPASSELGNLHRPLILTLLLVKGQIM